MNRRKKYLGKEKRNSVVKYETMKEKKKEERKRKTSMENK